MSQPALQRVELSVDPPETELVARARAGDADAVDRLVRRHLEDVYAVTSRLLGDRELAQDAAQDAVINALKALDRFRGDSSFRTWLIRIAVNAARTVGRRRSRRREVSIDAAMDAAADTPDTASVVAMQDEANRVTALLDRLPEKQRMAVSLRVQLGMSYYEIGEALECSEGAARVNYHLGIKRLRELMK